MRLIINLFSLYHPQSLLSDMDVDVEKAMDGLNRETRNANEVCEDIYDISL